MENGVRIKIQTPTHWNLIGRSMTAPSPGLSPSSNLPPTFAQFRPQSDNAKFGASQELCFFVRLLFKKRNWSETAKVGVKSVSSDLTIKLATNKSVTETGETLGMVH